MELFYIFIVQPSSVPRPQVTPAPRPRVTPSAPSAPPAFEIDEEFTPSALYPSISEGAGGEIQCEFFHPPPYIPEDEFDLPPSYDDVLQENTTDVANGGDSGGHTMHLVAAQ